ncbi:MAG: hypothetical protein ACRD2R_07210 [Terriglobales bacterium]
MNARLSPAIRRRGFPCPPCELPLYRAHTVSLLRRYFRLSIEVGRLPSLIGQEFFRARVSSFRAPAFEDAVIFVHDVERCLDRLDGFDRRILARIVFQEYSHEEAARLLHCTRRTLTRLLPEVLDEVSNLFLRLEIMPPLPCHRPNVPGPESCQERKNVIFSPTSAK